MIKAELDFECDISELLKLGERLDKIENKEAEYGYYSEQKHPETELSLADLANIHEEGSKWHPARHMMYESGVYLSLDNSSRKAASDFLYYGISLEKCLKDLGLEGAEKIQQTVDGKLLTPPNAPQTVARKGFNHPMKETGYLSQNAKVKVVRTEKV